MTKEKAQELLKGAKENIIDLKRNGVIPVLNTGTDHNALAAHLDLNEYNESELEQILNSDITAFLDDKETTSISTILYNINEDKPFVLDTFPDETIERVKIDIYYNPHYNNFHIKYVFTLKTRDGLLRDLFDNITYFADGFERTD